MPATTYHWKRIDKTTPSGKQLYQCTGCGCEDPAPTKYHNCVEFLKYELGQLRYKYERAGITCHSGHENNLPLALWDCPMCVEEMRAALVFYANNDVKLDQGERARKALKWSKTDVVDPEGEQRGKGGSEETEQAPEETQQGEVQE